MSRRWKQLRGAWRTLRSFAPKSQPVRESAIAEIETDSKTKNCSEKKRRLREQRDNVNGNAANVVAVGCFPHVSGEEMRKERYESQEQGQYAPEARFYVDQDSLLRQGAS